MSSATLKRISEWANASEHEDHESAYFYESSHYREVLDRKKILVIGRKGAGKTALAQQIARTTRSDTIVSGVNISAIDLPDSGRPAQALGSSEVLTKAWKNIILRAAAENCLDHIRATGADRAKLEARIGLNHEHKQNNLGRLKSVRLDAHMLGLEVGLHRPEKNAASSIEDRNALLLDFLAENFFGKSMYILFDGLDQGYIQSSAENRHSTYLRVIASLIRAAIETKNEFKEIGRTVLPTVFIRSDIFQQLRADDRNKWADNQGVRLLWEPRELEIFCRHRIHCAAKLNRSKVTEQEALSNVFKYGTQKVIDFSGNDKRLPLTKYIVDFSLNRPRDVVTFLRAAALTALQEAQRLGREVKIDKNILEESKRNFGLFLKAELSEELAAEFPIMGILLNRLSALKKRTFSYQDFCSIVERTQNGTTEGDKYKMAARLFDLGFFGQIMGDGETIFSLRNDEAFFDETSLFLVHPCYARALNLAETPAPDAA